VVKVKKIEILAITLVVLLSLSSIGSAATIKNTKQIKEPDKANPEDVEYYALIIGVEVFAGGNMYPEEDKIDDDAVNMYNLLLNSSNWKEENIKLMLNEQAHKDEIRDAIVGWLDEKEDENDVVLIYYTSHGWKTRLRNRKYGNAAIFTYNVTENRSLEQTLTDKEFDAYLDELESQHIAIILGSCYSGRMLALRQKGRILLAAGGKYFFCGVDEDDTLGGGIFSYFVQQGLKGVADLNNDGWVTAEEVFLYAKKPTIHFSIFKQFPFVITWMNRTMIWFFQVPRMYDRHPGGLKLYQYREDL
jgi:hypothetical protein